MSYTKYVRAATPAGDDRGDIESVDLRRLPPLTTLLVRTVNSVYRVVVTEGQEVCVQGGVFFPDPTSAYVDGARLGGNWFKVGWIGIGLLVQISSADQSIITSPGRGIVIEPPSGSTVH